jgi:hypothetical protein
MPVCPTTENRRMPRIPALPALLLCLALPAHAEDPAPASAATTVAPDAALGKQLTAAGVKFSTDKDGDYQMTFELEDGRTQLVYALSRVESYGSNRVREIWSPGYRYSTPELDAKVANRLLEHSGNVILGGWVRQKSTAMFVVKLAADASPAELRDAIEAAAACADTLEKELTGGKDEF